MNIDMPAGDRAVVQHPHSRNVAVDKAQLDLLARHDIVAEAGFAGGHQSLEVERPGAAGRNATKESPVRVEGHQTLVDNEVQRACKPVVLVPDGGAEPRPRTEGRSVGKE